MTKYDWTKVITWFGTFAVGIIVWRWVLSLIF